MHLNGSADISISENWTETHLIEAVTWVPSSLAMTLHAISLRHTQEAKTACNEHHIYTKDNCTALPASHV